MGIPLSTLSSPSLDGGLVPAYGLGDVGPFTSAFTVDPSDTNSLGFSASMTNMNGDIQAQYTDTANTPIGTGPMTLALDSFYGEGFILGTYAMYFGQTTATVSPQPTTTTMIVPGQATYLATKTETVFVTTETKFRFFYEQPIITIEHFQLSVVSINCHFEPESPFFLE
ncbi:unnamed protein product [Aureobasidium vineae]|uniref:Uncharacterized protein n=1 Tax=Aureobasidium vineae TaxID=2773715 RepID=A0A9N8P5P2_9PEZI|nr:unnamed protein product [Aureobasidium vineae]